MNQGGGRAQMNSNRGFSSRGMGGEDSTAAAEEGSAAAVEAGRGAAVDADDKRR